jgi:hypothetical protein
MGIGDPGGGWEVYTIRVPIHRWSVRRGVWTEKKKEPVRRLRTRPPPIEDALCMI